MTDMSDDIEGQARVTAAGVSDVSDDSRGHRPDDPATVTDTSDDTVGQVEAGGWMTMPQAALHYRKSTKTIERWVDAGKLQKHPTARPVEVWVPGVGAGGGASDMSDDTVGPDERAVALAERVSDAIGWQVAPILVALERSEERARVLERENGALTERVTGLERDLVTVRQASDADRQRLSAELEAARSEFAALEAENATLDATGAAPGPIPSPAPAWRWWPLRSLSDEVRRSLTTVLLIVVVLSLLVWVVGPPR